MKKTVKLIALMLVLVMALGALASCGKTIKGEYEATVLGTGVNYKFSGKDVAITVKVIGLSADPVNATYEIKDGKITFDIPDDADVSDKVKEVLDELKTAIDFAEGKDDKGNYIQIGSTKYYEVKD